MKLKQLLFVLPLLSCAAQAGYVDYRHEYYDDGRNYDRVYMSHRFGTGFGVAVEAVSRSDEKQSNDALNNMESNSNEYTASYQFTWQGFIWQPGVAVEMGDDMAIYKPYLRVQYNINESWWTAFRYRTEYTRRNADGKDDRLVYRPEMWLGYNIDNWMFELNGIYKFADNEDLYGGSGAAECSIGGYRNGSRQAADLTAAGWAYCIGYRLGYLFGTAGACGAQCERA